MSKLLLQNVRPIPRPSDLRVTATVDVLVGEDGRIERVSSETSGRRPSSDEATVFDGRGAYLSPGWVDLHTHIYYGATDISIRPVQAGMATGVTTLVDAGSAGEANFTGFQEYIAGGAQEAIFAFLNIGSIGLVACNRVSELRELEDIDVDRALATAEAHPELIKGIKVRASHMILGGWGITPVRVAKKVARILRLPLMVHIGESPPTLDEVLAALDPGDVVTHCFNGKRGGNILDDERVLETARNAQSDGILFDVGHGAGSFSFDIARRAIELGVLPYSISTDLHQRNVHGPVWDLATTLSKIMALGMPLEEIIPRVTEHPARVVGLDRDGARWLEEGATADFTLFDVVDGSVELADAIGDKLRVERLITPMLAVRGAKAVEARTNRRT